MKSYRASVIISGAETQHIYGSRLKSVKRRAIKLLTHWEPGFGNTHPQCVNVFEKVGEISGNLSEWALIETIPYASLSEDQLEWKKRKKNA